MKFIPEGQMLKQFENLVRNSDAIDIAVAWISPSAALNEIFRVTQHSKIQIVTGVGGYLTNPDVLERAASAVTLRIYGGPTGPLFHPKLYIFKKGFRSKAWIGSANLTRSAFEVNTELIVEMDDVHGVSRQEFKRFWDSPAAVPFAAFDLATYKSNREAILRSSAERSASALLPADSLQDAQTDQDPLKSSWASYVVELKATDSGKHDAYSLNKRLRVLAEGNALIFRDWGTDLSQHDLAMMYGNRGFEVFGRLRAIQQKRFQGGTGRTNRLLLGTSLKEAANMKHFDNRLVQRLFENLCEVDGCGPALATRLLVLARPDIFVVINKKSFKGLTARFNMKFQKKITALQYASLLQEIQEQSWCKSPSPTALDELVLWQARTALIDLLVYREEVGEYDD